MLFLNTSLNKVAITQKKTRNEKSTKTGMVQVIVTFIGLHTCYFMTASHPVFFFSSSCLLSCCHIDSRFQNLSQACFFASSGIAFHYIFQDFKWHSQLSSWTSTCTFIETCVFPTVLNQRTTPFAGSLRPILCPSGVSFKSK